MLTQNKSTRKTKTNKDTKEVKKVTKQVKKKTVRKSKKHDLHAILRRKKILCHTCKLREKCADAISKMYPYICMLYEAEEK